MKVLGMYTSLTLTIKRRVQAPFTVLSRRGHDFSFMLVGNFTAGLSFGYDVTILPNWILSDAEIEELEQAIGHGRVFVYDLSNLDLLQNEAVQRTIQRCQLVTVPNEYFMREVRGLNSHVEVIPSCVDVDFFWDANREPMPPLPCIGCFGPYHWHLVEEALITIREKRGGDQIAFLGGPEAVSALGEGLITQIPASPIQYPRAVHACLFGLAPLDGHRDQVDSIWMEEYGTFSRPVLSLAFKPRETSVWVQQIERYLSDSKIRSERGMMAYEQATAHRAVKMVDAYQRVYRKKLPHLFLVR